MLEYLHVRGGRPLEGEIEAAGAKNAMTKLLVASLLSDKRCMFHNVPSIKDVEVTVDLCREIGMEVQWDREEKTMEVCTKELKTSYIPQRFSGANRIPILMIGALLGRTREDIIVPTVGGCHIGKRPVNFHIEALERLGASIEYRQMQREGAYFAHAHDGLKGARIDLPYPSVGATENSILAAVCAAGVTEIRNAAVEPEIVDLVLFLQKLGAQISIDVGRVIRIQGTRQFYEVEHTVIPDRIEVASFALAAVATGGRVMIKGVPQLLMITFLNRLREVGGSFQVVGDGIEFFAEGPLKGGVHLETDVYPGFSTDWQQPFVVLLTQAQGVSVVHETVYENRFGYTETLKSMGADIYAFTECLGGRQCRFSGQNYPHSIVVKGPTALHGGKISIPDLRAGFAYVMAALLSEEESEIYGLSYLDRGYEAVEQKLLSLGADIQRLEGLQLSNSSSATLSA